MLGKQKLPFKVGDKFVFRRYGYHKGTFVEIGETDVRWEPEVVDKAVSYYYKIANLLIWIERKEIIIIRNKIDEVLYGRP